MRIRLKQILNSISPIDMYVQLSGKKVESKYLKNGFQIDKNIFENHAGIELFRRMEKKTFSGQMKKFCVIKRAVLDYQKSCIWLTAAGLVACCYDQKVLAAICALTLVKLGLDWKTGRQDRPEIMAPPITPDRSQIFNAEDYLSDEQFYEYMGSIPDEIDQFPKSYPDDGSNSGSRDD